ncbi:hypothetical protein NUITMVS1_26660 [Shewanella xiamenensis]|nr:hypothetical protein NUITMVS1_26660 [Shewanella xiamenensis]
MQAPKLMQPQALKPVHSAMDKGPSPMYSKSTQLINPMMQAKRPATADIKGTHTMQSSTSKEIVRSQSHNPLKVTDKYQ